MPVGGAEFDRDIARLFQKLDRPLISPVDDVHLAGNKRIGSGGTIDNEGYLDAVDKSAIGPPEMRIACGAETDTGNEALKDIGTRANRLRPVGKSIRHDLEVEITEQIDQFGIA